jgi:hypothetical protein
MVVFSHHDVYKHCDITTFQSNQPITMKQVTSEKHGIRPVTYKIGTIITRGDDGPIR